VYVQDDTTACCRPSAGKVASCQWLRSPLLVSGSRRCAVCFCFNDQDMGIGALCAGFVAAHVLDVSAQQLNMCVLAAQAYYCALDCHTTSPGYCL
jgi:hypothetical protein